MKNLKNIMAIFTLALVMLVSVNVSAQSKKTEPIKSGPIVLDPGNSTIPVLKDFSRMFPEEFKKINQNYFQNEEGNLIKSLEELTKLNYFTAPIMERNNVIGRIIFTNGKLVYFNLKDYRKKVDVSLFKKDKSVQKIALATTLNNNKYEVAKTSQAKVPWCEIQCTLATAAILLSDGPLPVMDIVAVAFQISCLKSCED